MDTVATTDRDRWIEANNRYLAASLRWLRLRLQRLAGAQPHTAMLPAPQPAPRGLSGWLGRTPETAHAPALPAPEPLAQQLDAAAAERAAAAQGEPPPALLSIAERLGLSPFEADTLLLCAAVELDPSVPALIAAAQMGSPTSAHPSFALAMRLFDEPAWDAVSPVRPLRHLRLLEASQPGATALTAAALRADERIVNAIKGLNHLDERLIALLQPVRASALSDTQLDCVDDVLAVLRAADAGAGIAIQLLGPDRGSRVAVAAQACDALGLLLYRVSSSSLPAQRPEIEVLGRLWQRESLLLPVALYIEADEQDAESDAASSVSALVSQPPGLVFVGLREAPLPLEAVHPAIEVPLPTASEQYHAWRGALPAALADEDRDIQATRLSGHFRFNLTQIRDAAAIATARGTDAWEASRDLSLTRLETLAQRLPPKATWRDLVLGEEALALLRQIATHVHQRHRVYQQWGYAQRMNRGMGINALFTGESGTGKTMAAEVIANELRLHLFRIDLSSVVSKYIGETEKNLRRLFDAAEQGGAILFFDEADALFGKRSEVKDSHDRYANIEINYLLQRMEAFSGLAILATNMKASMDPAFMRRLRFVVNFQFPGAEERKRIWRNALPPSVPCGMLDYDRLARFGLSGGNIHGIALNAAFTAAAGDTPVDMAHMLAAVRTELRKLGKPVSEGEFR